jgi:hypothetical protein
MIMLALMFALFIEWAIRNQKETNDVEEKERLEELFTGRVDTYTRWIRFLVNIQLFSLSLFNVPFIKIRIDQMALLSEGLQSIGLELNSDSLNY